jgi:hypothetical protein
LQQHNTNFQFLYNRRSLQNMSKEHAIKRWVDLHTLFTDKETGKADIDELQMMEEQDALSVLANVKALSLQVLQ